VIDQAMVDGVEGEFEPVGDSQLIEDIVQMVFDRLLADEELFADLFIAVTLRHDTNQRSMADLLCVAEWPLL
jgi:hypothetical protein